MLVLQPGNGGSGSGYVWRFDAATGAKLTGFGYENEGFYHLSTTAEGDVYVTSNILGGYDLYHFNAAGTYLGITSSISMGDQGNTLRGPDGNLYCTAYDESTQTWRVLRLDRREGSVFIPAGRGGMTSPVAMFLGADGNLYLADAALGILRYQGTTGAFIDVFVPLGRGGLQGITRMAFAPDGALCVASSADNAVYRFSGSTGAFIDRIVPPASGGLVNPRGLAFGPDGNLYVTSRDTHQVLCYDGRTGAFLRVAASDPQLRLPADIAFTPAIGSETVWVEDAVPAGANPSGNGENWTWVDTVQGGPVAYSGTRMHNSPQAATIHEHFFTDAADGLAVGAGDILFVYVSPNTQSGWPGELMLSWHDGTSWEHRAYWGLNAVTYGDNGSAGRRYMGQMPRSTIWTRLEVPASAVGLEGKTVRGMAFTVAYGGVYWDRAGIIRRTTTSAPADTTPPVVAMTAPAGGATLRGSITLSANASDNSSVPGVAFMVDRADGYPINWSPASPPYQVSWNTTSVANGPHTLYAVATDAAGNRSVSPGISVTVDNPPPPPPPPPSTAWFDDDLPAGASGSGTNGEGWNWISSNPNPNTGDKAHQSILAPGIHSHGFNFGSPLAVGAGDYLYAWVYIDPANPPQELMLSWCDSSNWEHRAYWGANLISYGNNDTPGRIRAGVLPPAGQWTQLKVAASSVGLEGRSISGMTFMLYDGRATWDSAGKTTSGRDSTPPVVQVSSPANNATVAGVVALSFTAADNDGVTYVGYQVDGTNADYISHGNSPYTFNWDSTHVTNGTHTLTVYAEDNSLNRTTVTRTVTVNNAPTGDTTPPTVTWIAPTDSATVSGALYLRVSASDNVRVAGVQFLVDGTVLESFTGGSSAEYSSWWRSNLTSNGSHLLQAIATDPSGNQRTAGIVVSVNNSGAAGAVTWMDSAVPAGAGTGATGGDGWNWVTTDPKPFAGTRAHQSNLAAGLHDHFFVGASTPLDVSAGDSMFVYVYLDPANPPQEIMLSWNDGNWEHRAYWGGNFITYGADGTTSRRTMGALPATGEWVRLLVPASAVGLEGQRVNGIGFSLYGGRATWDLAGKVK